MVEYITWLKALAALLITNSHLGHIYPVESLANGGLLGNLLFFAVSGFCLCNIRQSFLPWYGRRLVRIYPAVWGITALGVLTGVYSLHSWTQALRLFLYPTYYHFIAAILLLYIPFYVVARLAGKSAHPARVLLVCGGGGMMAYAACYLLVFDTSYYHIDTVEEPMILFSYAVAMLMGALFRIEGVGGGKLLSVSMLVIFGALYVLTKTCVASGAIPPAWQFVNQVSILMLLYALLRAGAAFNSCLEHAPALLRKPAALVASITLEIYLIQYLIFAIPHLAEQLFPLNLLLTLAGIVLAAWPAHLIVNRLISIRRQQKAL